MAIPMFTTEEIQKWQPLSDEQCIAQIKKWGFLPKKSQMLYSFDFVDPQKPTYCWGLPENSVTRSYDIVPFVMEQGNEFSNASIGEITLRQTAPLTKWQNICIQLEWFVNRGDLHPEERTPERLSEIMTPAELQLRRAAWDRKF